MSTITDLAKANVKMDKTKSILIVLSILLTTLLLAAVSGAGYGLIKMQESNAARFYGDFYGRYRNITQQNIEEMMRHAAFCDIGKCANYAEVDNKKDLVLQWRDKKAREMLYTDNYFIEGHYPEAENEIAAAPNFFKQLGLQEPKIGDSVTIYFRTNLKSAYASEEFVICGLMKQSEEIETNSMVAYTSQKHFEKSVLEADRKYWALFRLDESINLTMTNAEDVMKELAVSCGIDEKDVIINNKYLSWKLNPETETVIICAMVCVVVIIFSVIVIYNIFQVGAIHKIQEYGKLKAIGATRKQMKQIIFREGMYLACIGVPIGLIGGIGVAQAALMYIIRDLMKNDISFEQIQISVVSVPILILVAALAFLTVWIALKKPMRVVASISPVEAIRYQESGKKAGRRKGKNTLNVVSLTFANLASHRKRTFSTILSMGLSGVLFVVVANWMGNMEEEYAARDVILHGQFQIELHYSMKDEAYPENNLNHILENNPLNEELIQKIQAIPEVTDIRTQKILYAAQLDENGKETDKLQSILVLDREDFDSKVKKDEVDGLDYDQMSALDAVCYGWIGDMEDSGFALGETYHFSLYDGVNKKTWNPQMISSFGYFDASMAMTKDTYEKMGWKGVTNYNLWIDCDKKDVETVGVALENLLEEVEHVEMDSYQNQLKIAEYAMCILKMPAYLFCIIIAFISFMNMTNTMIISIVTRKREFGILQAVGMTNTQLDRSLQLEGILLSVGTAVVSLAVGSPLGYAFFRYCKSQAFVGLNTYHFPIVEVLAMLIALGILQLLLSFILSRNIKKESLVERIRYRG